MILTQTIGRLTKEPEIHVSQSGTSLAKFTLASGRDFKREGEPTADFIPCTAFGKTAEVVEKFLHKGSKVFISGVMQNDAYEKDGVKKDYWNVKIDKLVFLDSKRDDSQSVETSSKSDGFTVPSGTDDMPFI